MDQRPFLIGVAGASGSGKTTFCDQLAVELGERCLLISCDNYYRPQDHLSIEERNRLNFDAPEAIDFELLLSQLSDLSRNDQIAMPQYDFSTHSRKAETVTTHPRPIIVVEGILLLAQQGIRERLDLRVFVAASAELCHERRLRRDVAERGRTPESVQRQWTETVMPMFERYVRPSRDHADIVVSTEGGSHLPTDTVVRGIGQVLKNTP